MARGRSVRGLGAAETSKAIASEAVQTILAAAAQFGNGGVQALSLLA